MKTMQEILDLALDSMLYISREEYDKLKLYLNDDHSYYMCDVLQIIYSDDLITREEYEFATDEIAEYIGEKHAGCMSLFLQKNSLPSSHEDKVKIYKNWDLRPKKALQNSLDVV